MSDKIREEFEEIFSQLPYEWDMSVQSVHDAFPGQYRHYHIQCAWEGYRTALFPQQQENEPVLQVTGRSLYPGYVICAELNGHGAVLNQQYYTSPQPAAPTITSNPSEWWGPVQVPESWREIVDAVAKIGTDSGDGVFMIDAGHIMSARLLIAATHIPNSSTHPAGNPGE